jgi:hypothetical protein
MTSNNILKEMQDSLQRKNLELMEKNEELVMKNQEIIKLTNVKSLLKKETCSCCMEEIPYEQKVTTHCNHHFCNECFWEWSKEHDSCPNCRANLSQRDRSAEMALTKLLGRRREISRMTDDMEDNLNNLKDDCKNYRSVRRRQKKYIKQNKKELANQERDICINDHMIEEIRLARINPKKYFQMVKKRIIDLGWKKAKQQKRWKSMMLKQLLLRVGGGLSDEKICKIHYDRKHPGSYWDSTVQTFQDDIKPNYMRDVEPSRFSTSSPSHQHYHSKTSPGRGQPYNCCTSYPVILHMMYSRVNQRIILESKNGRKYSMKAVDFYTKMYQKFEKKEEEEKFTLTIGNMFNVEADRIAELNYETDETSMANPVAFNPFDEIESDSDSDSMYDDMPELEEVPITEDEHLILSSIGEEHLRREQEEINYYAENSPYPFATARFADNASMPSTGGTADMVNLSNLQIRGRSIFGVSGVGTGSHINEMFDHFDRQS